MEDEIILIKRTKPGQALNYLIGSLMGIIIVAVPMLLPEIFPSSPFIYII